MTKPRSLFARASLGYTGNLSETIVPNLCSRFSTAIRTPQRWLVLVAALVGALLATDDAFAQTAGTQAATTTLSGVVLDETGATIADVEVIVVSATVGLQRSVRTDAEGAFLIPLLPPGLYVVTAQREGFAAAEIESVELSTNDVTRLTIELKVASIGERVMVTAQKREERVEDVPAPVSVIKTERLADKNQVLLKDYYNSVPGLTVQQDVVAQQVISIRGVTTGGSTLSTVGFVIDDVPFGAAASGGNYLPDIDPGDLERIEVLRGPQGTLYGANSLGGLIKFVTKAPSTAAFTGRLELGTSTVYNGNEPGFTMRASANIPVSSKVAMRVSGFKRQDPGYIDNPTFNIRGVNEANTEGARVSVLWTHSNRLSVNFGALYQYTKGQGGSETYTRNGLGDLEQDPIPQTGWFDRNSQTYSATVKARMGRVDLTSITAVRVNRARTNLDFSYAFGSFAESHYGVPGAIYEVHVDSEQISQEVRLSGSLGARAEWMVGGFYARDDTPNVQTISPAELDNSTAIASDFYVFDQPILFDESAIFGSLMYRLTDRFDIQLGGRRSHTQYASGPVTQRGRFFGPEGRDQARSTSEASPLTYLLSPRLRLAPNAILYARFASSFRTGWPNTFSTVVNLPSGSRPDTTRTYEVGFKGNVLGNRLALDVSVYYIDWQDIQLTLRDPATSFNYSSNGGTARSTGIEAGFSTPPLRGLTVAGWVAYDNAELTEAFPLAATVRGEPGDRLPYSPRHSGSLSLTQEFPLMDGIVGHIGGDVARVGDRVGSFRSGPRQTLDSYTKTDLRAGVSFHDWSAHVYVNNVGDVRGFVGGGVDSAPPFGFVYITPRTVGVSLRKTF